MSAERSEAKLLKNVHRLLYETMTGRGGYRPALILIGLAILKNATKPLGRVWRAVSVGSFRADDDTSRRLFYQAIFEGKDTPPNSSDIQQDIAETYVVYEIAGQTEVQSDRCFVVEILDPYDFQDCGCILSCQETTKARIWRTSWESIRSEDIDLSVIVGP